MFIGSCNGLFRRLDAKTGKVIWETNVRGGAPDKYFFHGDVFVAPDRIIASADVPANTGAEAGIHAFDIDSGRHLWKYPAGHGVPGAAIGFDRRVAAYTAAGDLVVLNIEDGKPEWSYPLKADGWESPTVVGARVLAGSSAVYAFDVDTGRVEWQRSLAAPVTTSVRATDSTVYVGTRDGMMHRLATSTGEVLSSLKLDPALKPGTAPSIRPDAVLVLLADQGANYRALVSLDRSLSRVNWRQDAADRWTTTRIFATETTVVVGTESGDVTAYCLGNGSPAWSHKLPGAPIRAIGGSGDVLYIGTPRGTLYAVGPPRSCK